MLRKGEEKKNTPQFRRESPVSLHASRCFKKQNHGRIAGRFTSSIGLARAVANGQQPVTPSPPNQPGRSIALLKSE